MDVFALFDADPAAFGLPAGINLTDACLGSITPEAFGPPCTAGHRPSRIVVALRA